MFLCKDCFSEPLSFSRAKSSASCWGGESSLPGWQSSMKVVKEAAEGPHFLMHACAKYLFSPCLLLPFPCVWGPQVSLLLWCCRVSKLSPAALMRGSSHLMHEEGSVLEGQMPCMDSSEPSAHPCLHGLRCFSEILSWSAELVTFFLKVFDSVGT